MRRQFPYKKLITLAIILAASVSLMNFTGRPQDGPSFWGSLFQRASSPMSRLVSRVGTYLDKVRNVFVDKDDLIRQKHELEGRLAGLEYLQSRLLEVEAENDRLRELLEFEEGTSGDYEVAKVLGRDPNKWFSSISISVGSSNGTQADAAVVSQSGLVGRILSLGEDTSTVLLLTDPESGVGAIAQRSRDLGVVLGGGGPDTLTARFFSKDADVRPGDLIVTSGMGSRFPGGILIGVVVSVQVPQPGLVKEATVKPSADVEHLEEVMVMGK